MTVILSNTVLFTNSLGWIHLKKAQHGKIENVTVSVWLSLFMDGTVKCKLPSTPPSTNLSRIQHLTWTGTILTFVKKQSWRRRRKETHRIPKECPKRQNVAGSFWLSQFMNGCGKTPSFKILKERIFFTWKYLCVFTL
jgi:hypothetical protein